MLTYIKFKCPNNDEIYEIEYNGTVKDFLDEYPDRNILDSHCMQSNPESYYEKNKILGDRFA